MRIFEVGWMGEYKQKVFWSAFAIVLLCPSTGLVAKNVLLGSPTMAGDEYAYFAQSREFPNSHRVYDYDPTMHLTGNILYLWLGKLAWNLTDDPAALIRTLQGFLYISTSSCATASPFWCGECDGSLKDERVVVIDWVNPAANDFFLASQVWIESNLYNFRPILAWLRDLWCLFLLALLQTISLQPELKSAS